MHVLFLAETNLAVIACMASHTVMMWCRLISLSSQICSLWMQVTSPEGNTVHSLKASYGDKFELKVPTNGMHKFCFHNPSSSPESVSFNIHVGHIPKEQDLAKDGSSFIRLYSSHFLPTLTYASIAHLQSISTLSMPRLLNWVSPWGLLP